MYKKKIVYILGAGCSQEDGIPLINDFLPFAFEQVKNEKEFNELRNFQRSFFPNSNVEELLGWLEFSIFMLSDKTSLPDEYIRNRELLLKLIIRTVEGKTLSPSDIYSRFFQNYVNIGSTESTILTFNWDNLLESSFKPSKKVAENESFAFDHGISIKSLDSEYETTKLKTKILKLHGSINWLVCNSCANDTGNDYIYFIRNKQILFQKKNERICPSCKGELKVCIVPPSFFKFDDNNNINFIKEIWYEARHALIEADKIVVIGYSFPGDDVHFKLFFNTAILENKKMYKRKPELHVVNYKPFLSDKNEFENHHKYLLKDIIVPQFHYMKFSNFSKIRCIDFFDDLRSTTI